LAAVVQRFVSSTSRGRWAQTTKTSSTHCTRYIAHGTRWESVSWPPRPRLVKVGEKRSKGIIECSVDENQSAAVWLLHQHCTQSRLCILCLEGFPFAAASKHYHLNPSEGLPVFSFYLSFGIVLGLYSMALVLQC
jgi:hypothetical protein